ncbi:MAG: glycosyl hydrolase family 95 catalytic domain-containing protein [Bryobacteraceae bacterium]
MRFSQASTLTALALLAAVGAHAASDAAWWYREPAGRYWEGLPLANGRLAAMVYGRVRDEVIPLNDETLWSGAPYDPNNPAGRAALPEIRKLLFAGRYREAQALCSKLLSVPLSVQHYQPLGELRIRFDGPAEGAGYRRELDMDSALARVTYRIGDTRYTREIFASFPDQVLVVRITADKPGRISLAVRLASIQPSARSRLERDGAITMTGTAETVTEGRSANPVIPARMRWESQVRIIREGGSTGTCRIAEDEETAACTSVTHANAVTLVLAAATNYVRWNDITADPESLVAARMRAADKPYRTLLDRHLRDWQPQFRAFRLDLGGDEAAGQDTTTRLDLLRRGAKDPLFTAQYAQYGRYLLLAVSRPGTLAFNNHNVWLDNMEGRWAGRWTLNINLEECYWPAENAGLPQTNHALLGFVEQLAEAGARTARELYGCRGWVAHHGTDLWMNTAPTDSTGPGIWPTAGPWLLQNLWEHYLFQPDPQYLKRLYPLLRGASEFFLDFLVEEPTHHWLVTAPSVSPENSFFTPEGQPTQVCMGPTLDNQLLRDLFDHTAQASRLLGVDSELRSQVENARRRLPPDRIGKHGQIEEWLQDFDEPEVTHRHLSPLYGLFPSNQITAATPDLLHAAEVTLARRTDKNLGWSGAWKINLYARLGNGEHAEEVLNRMLVEVSLHPAKEDSNRVPSLEGNQGIQGVTAGVAEMLLQSHEGELRLLPALPRDWPAGHVEGLRARGGFVVGMDWRNGALERVVVRSVLGGECRLRYGSKRVSFITRAGQLYERDGQLQ